MGATIKNEEHQWNVDLEAGDKISVYINDVKIAATEFTVNTSYKASVTYAYQETPL